jgi:DNA repair photolyase
LRVLDTRARGATFVEHRVKSIVNSPESTGMGFWSINPYVGCELGCTYCYARYAHRYVVERAHTNGQLADADFEQLNESKTWEAFERRIFVKQRDAVLDALERDLSSIRRRHNTGRIHPIVIGTATDPYQPAERQFRITRAVLERLSRESNLSVGIITKNPMVSQDIGLLKTLQRNNRVSVYISLISTDIRIIRLFEARSPMPHVRLKALKKLVDANLNAGLLVAPVLPGITDTLSQVRALARALKKTGGRFAHPSPLRLYPALHSGFLPIIEEHFPELYPKYRRAYRGTGAAPKRYTDAVVKRFRDVAEEIGVPVKDSVLEGGAYRPRAVTISLPANPDVESSDSQLGFWE